MYVSTKKNNTICTIDQHYQRTSLVVSEREKEREVCTQESKGGKQGPRELGRQKGEKVSICLYGVNDGWRLAAATGEPSGS